MSIFTVAALVCGAFAAAEAPSDDDVLAKLSSLVDNEQAFVSAVRSYDLQQQKLIAWDKEMAEKHMLAGDQELARMKSQQIAKRVATIRKAYQMVLDAYPKNARANTYYGELLYDQFGEVAGAIQAWKLAEVLDKKLSEPRNDLGLHYCTVGEYKTGLDYLEAALALEPNHPDYLYNLVQMYLVHFPEIEKRYGWSREKVYEKAMELSRKAAEKAPDDYEIVSDYALNFFTGLQFRVEPDWAKAVQAWQKAFQLAPDPDRRVYCLMYEARAWLRAGNTDKAIETVNEVLKIQPDSEGARQFLISIREKGQPAEPATEP